MSIKGNILGYTAKVFTKIYAYNHPIEKQILFSSFEGTHYSDNPRAISETMHELYPDYKLVWFLENDDEVKSVPDYITITRSGIEFFKYLATSICFVNNFQFKRKIYKRRNQLFIQTWHADRIFKKVLLDAEPFLPMVEKRVTDLCIAGSVFGIKQYHSAFNYSGKIMCVGTPRNDKLLKLTEDDKIKLKKIFNVEQNCNILLYAPTFREYSNKYPRIQVNIKKVLDILNEKNERWICFLRSHPGIGHEKLGFHCDNINFFDMSSYPDMRDLLCVADMLITDYSSCAFDLAVIERKVILAIFDLNYYTSIERSLAVDPHETGFLIAWNQSELEDLIRNTTDKEYMDNNKKIREFFDIKETGESSEKICNYINGFYLKQFSKS